MNEILLESLELHNELMTYCIEANSIKNTIEHVIRKTKIFLKKIVTSVLNVIDRNIFTFKTLYTSSDTIRSIKEISKKETKPIVVELYDDLALHFHQNIINNVFERQVISKAPETFIKHVLDKGPHEFNKSMDETAQDFFKKITLSDPKGITVSNLHSELNKMANTKTKIELTETHIKLYKGAVDEKELNFAIECKPKQEQENAKKLVKLFVLSSKDLDTHHRGAYILRTSLRKDYIAGLKELDRIYTYAIKNAKTKKDEEIIKKKLLYQTKYINSMFAIKIAGVNYYITASNNYIKNFKIITKALKEKIE